MMLIDYRMFAHIVSEASEQWNQSLPGHGSFVSVPSRARKFCLWQEENRWDINRFGYPRDINGLA